MATRAKTGLWSGSMKEIILAIVLAILFTGYIVWASPYGGQHEPLSWLIWFYQNVGIDL